MRLKCCIFVLVILTSWITSGLGHGLEVTLDIRGGWMKWSGGEVKVGFEIRYNGSEYELLEKKSDFGLTGKALIQKFFLGSDSAIGRDIELKSGEPMVSDPKESKNNDVHLKVKKYQYQFQIFELEDLKTHPMRLEFVKKAGGESEVIYAPYSLIRIENADATFKEDLATPLFPMPWHLKVNWTFVGFLLLIVAICGVIVFEWRQKKKLEMLIAKTGGATKELGDEGAKEYEKLVSRVAGLDIALNGAELREIYQEMEKFLRVVMERNMGVKVMSQNHEEVIQMMKERFGGGLWKDVDIFFKGVKEVRFGSRNKELEEVREDIKKGFEIIQQIKTRKEAIKKGENNITG